MLEIGYLQSLLSENAVFLIGFLFILSFFNKLISAKLKIPEVTGYVFMGVILGKSFFNLLEGEAIEHLHSLSNVALGIIALTIGLELKWDVIKKLGKSIFLIVLFECIGAFGVVFLAMTYLAKMPIYESILFAAVASATAPAATVAVIKQFKAKGKLTSTILAVVGIDDAVALVIFVLASGISKAMLSGKEIIIGKVIGSALILIILSVLIGTISAFIYLIMVRKVKNEELRRILLIGFVLAILGITEIYQISELLTIMIFGITISNLSYLERLRIEKSLKFLSPIFLSLFFILGGAHLDFSLIGKIGIVGLVYFVSRSMGKILGGNFGATIGGADKNVKKYIGFALLPQVGVALALALSIKNDFYGNFGEAGDEFAITVLNVLLFTTIITELVGPITTKYVLKKSNEIE